jgi:hypothetical protein
MRTLLTAVVVCFVLVATASAGNVALSMLGATATCGGSITPCFRTVGANQYLPANAIDGDLGTEWVAPAGGPIDPYLLINLGQEYNINNIAVDGVGNLGNDIQFEVFASATDSTASALLADPTALISAGNVTETGGSAWSASFSFAPTTEQYILYYVTCSVGNTAGCTGFGAGLPSLDAGYTTEITANQVPEPGTLALVGAGLLALGFRWRSRK